MLLEMRLGELASGFRLLLKLRRSGARTPDNSIASAPHCGVSSGEILVEESTVLSPRHFPAT